MKQWDLYNKSWVIYYISLIHLSLWLFFFQTSYQSLGVRKCSSALQFTFLKRTWYGQNKSNSVISTKPQGLKICNYSCLPFSELFSYAVDFNVILPAKKKMIQPHLYPPTRLLPLRTNSHQQLHSSLNLRQKWANNVLAVICFLSQIGFQHSNLCYLHFFWSEIGHSDFQFVTGWGTFSVFWNGFCL